MNLILTIPIDNWYWNIITSNGHRVSFPLTFADHFPIDIILYRGINRCEEWITRSVIKNAFKNREWYIHGESGRKKECLKVSPMETLAAKVGKISFANNPNIPPELSLLMLMLMFLKITYSQNFLLIVTVCMYVCALYHFKAWFLFSFLFIMEIITQC